MGQSADASEPAIQCRDVTKSYGRGSSAATVLAGTNFVVAAGSHVAITGPSGSGKSTLLRIIGGLSRPDGGVLRVFGQDLYHQPDRRLSRYRNRTVGYVFQDYRLIAHYSVLDNVMVPLKVSGLRRRLQVRHATDALTRVGLADRAKARVTDLSGGQQQRVGIARAIVTRPRLLLADEPTGNLDSHTGDSVMALIRDLQSILGTTLVTVTHNDEIAAGADQRIHLRDGRIVSGDHG